MVKAVVLDGAPRQAETGRQVHARRHHLKGEIGVRRDFLEQPKEQSVFGPGPGDDADRALSAMSVQFDPVLRAAGRPPTLPLRWERAGVGLMTATGFNVHGVCTSHGLPSSDGGSGWDAVRTR